MRAQTLHLRILILLLTLAGLLLTGYQIFVLKIPLSEHETDYIWNVDAKITFRATNKVPVKLEMYVPPQSDDFMVLNESYVSRNYGVSINEQEQNRQIIWSSRRASGEQTLFYRLLLSSRFNAGNNKAPGPEYREAIPLEGAEALAAEALLQSIRQNSADVETFIAQAIKLLNDASDENIKLLLHQNNTLAHKLDVLETLLANAHIPIQRLHVIRLTKSVDQQPQLWLRSYNGNQWLYFNMENGLRKLPADSLIWWYGNTPLMRLDGGSNPHVSFAVSSNEVNAIRLGQLIENANATTRFLDNSLYGLPLSDQQIYQLIVMIPVGVLFILILRNLIGIQTLGTFTPVLIAMAFRETGLLFGVVFFSVITALGLMLRSYLEYLRLQMLPRLSVVLSFVVIIMALISLFSHKLGLESGLSVSLFPMVILTMTIERLSITWDEHGGNTAFKQGITTLLAAAGAFYLMNIPALRYFMFTFPAVLLIMIAFMLAMGRYRGYRLSELLRFQAMLKD